MTTVRAREGAAFIIDIVDWWCRLRARRHSLAELDRYPASVELLARDVNLSPSALRAIAAKWPDGGDLLGRRLSSLEIDPEPISSDQYRVRGDLERVCTLCGDKSRCERDLAGDAGGEEWRGYCLNVGTLDALRPQTRAGNSRTAERK